MGFSRTILTGGKKQKYNTRELGLENSMKRDENSTHTSFFLYLKIVFLLTIYWFLSKSFISSVKLLISFTHHQIKKKIKINKFELQNKVKTQQQCRAHRKY